jgi:hypothetical protein
MARTDGVAAGMLMLFRSVQFAEAPGYADGHNTPLRRIGAVVSIETGGSLHVGRADVYRDHESVCAFEFEWL